MEASWSFLDAPWAAKVIFERFGSDFDGRNESQFGQKIVQGRLKIDEKSNQQIHLR